MCKDGLLGPSNYWIFEDWLAVDRSREGYLRIRDGLVSEGEIQEMEDKENHYDKGPYKAHIHAFFLAYHQMRGYHCWLSCHPMDLERYCKFEVSMEQVMFPFSFVGIFCSNGQKRFSFGTHIRQAWTKHLVSLWSWVQWESLSIMLSGGARWQLRGSMGLL